MACPRRHRCGSNMFNSNAEYNGAKEPAACQADKAEKAIQTNSYFLEHNPYEVGKLVPQSHNCERVCAKIDRLSTELSADLAIPKPQMLLGLSVLETILMAKVKVCVREGVHRDRNAKTSTMLFVVGPPGSGKTRLLHFIELTVKQVTSELKAYNVPNVPEFSYCDKTTSAKLITDLEENNVILDNDEITTFMESIQSDKGLPSECCRAIDGERLMRNNTKKQVVADKGNKLFFLCGSTPLAVASKPAALREHLATGLLSRCEFIALNGPTHKEKPHGLVAREDKITKELHRLCRDGGDEDEHLAHQLAAVDNAIYNPSSTKSGEDDEEGDVALGPTSPGAKRGAPRPRHPEDEAMTPAGPSTPRRRAARAIDFSSDDSGVSGGAETKTPPDPSESNPSSQTSLGGGNGKSKKVTSSAHKYIISATPRLSAAQVTIINNAKVQVTNNEDKIKAKTGIDERTNAAFKAGLIDDDSRQSYASKTCTPTKVRGTVVKNERSCISPVEYNFCFGAIAASLPEDIIVSQHAQDYIGDWEARTLNFVRNADYSVFQRAQVSSEGLRIAKQWADRAFDRCVIGGLLSVVMNFTEQLLDAYLDKMCKEELCVEREEGRCDAKLARFAIEWVEDMQFDSSVVEIKTSDVDFGCAQQAVFFFNLCAAALGKTYLELRQMADRHHAEEERNSDNARRAKLAAAEEESNALEEKLKKFAAEFARADDDPDTCDVEGLKREHIAGLMGRILIFPRPGAILGDRKVDLKANAKDIKFKTNTVDDTFSNLRKDHYHITQAGFVAVLRLAEAYKFIEPLPTPESNEVIKEYTRCPPPEDHDELARWAYHVQKCLNCAESSDREAVRARQFAQQNVVDMRDQYKTSLAREKKERGPPRGLKRPKPAATTAADVPPAVAEAGTADPVRDAIRETRDAADAADAMQAAIVHTDRDVNGRQGGGGPAVAEALAVDAAVREQLPPQSAARATAV